MLVVSQGRLGSLCALPVERGKGFLRLSCLRRKCCEVSGAQSHTSGVGKSRFIIVSMGNAELIKLLH